MVLCIANLNNYHATIYLAVDNNVAFVCIYSLYKYIIITAVLVQLAIIKFDKINTEKRARI